MKPRFVLISIILAGALSLCAASGWTPLWDGKTFAGWHVIGKGEWKIEDGAIHAKHMKAEREFSHLVTDNTYRDFTVRLKFKALAGNSGLYFRTEEKGGTGVSGFQADIDPRVDVGGLYETNGRLWVSQPTPEQVKGWFKPGEWNDMVVSARGGHIVGYQRLLESGVEAVALETPPYFFPEHARAAVDAGLHVYMAKPVAVDVPGALQILAAGKEARRRQCCFLVDYQMPTDPLNIEVVRRIHSGGLGRIAQVRTAGINGEINDPPKTKTIESRLQNLIWVADVALGCDVLGNFDIHAIDAALWALGQRPVAASGKSRIARPNPHGDARDVCSLVYEYADGTVHNHYGQSLKNSIPELSATICGTEANALVNYWGRAFMRGGPHHFGGGDITDLYRAGAERNIARFYRDITEENFTNNTLERSVDGVLACVLGYEAAWRGARLTMETVLKENKRLDLDLRGLKT